MWRAIETECAARRVTLKKFVLDIVEGHLREIGGWKEVGVVPRFSETPGNVHHAGPTLGQHNDEVYGGLGVSPAEIAQLKARKVI